MRSLSAANRLKIGALIVIVVSALLSDSAHALRCGTDIISEGQSITKVRRVISTCGSVVDREILRSAHGSHSYKMEEWYVRVYGQCYSLNFRDRRLRGIHDEGKCN